MVDERGVYRSFREHAAILGGMPLTLVTRPGFPDWESVSPAMSLVAEYAALSPEERVVIGPCGHAALGVWAAQYTAPANITCLDTNWIAAQAAEATLRRNGVPEVTVHAQPPRPALGPWDVATLLLPKGRLLARLWLLNFALGLKPHGRLYLAGPNQGGIKSFLRDAEALLGPGILLGYRSKGRIAQFTRPEILPQSLPPPFAEAGLLDGTYATFHLNIAGIERPIYSRPGVFSHGALDAGTRLLLEVLEVYPTDRMLDWGCGYGIIGLYAALNAPGIQVTLVDVDALACECAYQTLRANGITAHIIHGDGLAAVGPRRFSLIASNPPFHAGHQVDLASTTAFIYEAYEALEPNGRLVLVANRFLPYPRILKERFERVEILRSDPQYQVLCAIK